MARRNDGKPTTSQLLNMIGSSKTFAEVTAYHKAEGEPTFSATLFDMMMQKNLSAKQMIVLTGIERSYYYHILSGTKRPGRNIVLRIAFCLKCTLHEVNTLLRLSGTSELYPRIRRDAILIFGLQRKYSMAEINDALIQEGEDPLYREEKDDPSL